MGSTFVRKYLAFVLMVVVTSLSGISAEASKKGGWISSSFCSAVLAQAGFTTTEFPRLALLEFIQKKFVDPTSKEIDPSAAHFIERLNSNEAFIIVEKSEPDLKLAAKKAQSLDRKSWLRSTRLLSDGTLLFGGVGRIFSGHFISATTFLGFGGAVAIDEAFVGHRLSPSRRLISAAAFATAAGILLHHGIQSGDSNLIKGGAFLCGLACSRFLGANDLPFLESSLMVAAGFFWGKSTGLGQSRSPNSSDIPEIPLVAGLFRGVGELAAISLSLIPHFKIFDSNDVSNRALPALIDRWQAGEDFLFEGNLMLLDKELKQASVTLGKPELNFSGRHYYQLWTRDISGKPKLYIFMDQPKSEEE